MNDKVEENFRSSNTCRICEKPNEHQKVRYHCHITGKYRGTAHWICNANLKLSKKVSIIFNNLKGYDSQWNWKS